MDNNILTATVAPVQIGRIEIEGLKVENGLFAVALQQAATLFSVLPKSAQKWIKSKLGKEFQFLQVKTNRNNGTRQNRAENAIYLDDFRKLVRKLDKENNRTASDLADALFGLSLEQLFADAFDVNLSKNDRQNIVSRIMSKACPWEKLYEKEMCGKVQKWYGFDSAKFYWWYCYSWLTPEEKAELEEVNPVEKLVAKSGKERIARKRKIHQHLEEQTRVRLTEFVQYLWCCIKFSDTKTEFEKKWNREYGQPEQLEIFDLWEFAD